MERTDEHLLTIQDVAKVLARSVGTVRQMIRTGEFPDGFPAPRKLYWRWGTVRRWIERHELMRELGVIPEQKASKPVDSAQSHGGGQKSSSKPH